MRSPNPSWRVKTRPCPFYLDGHCLFADSCNFLHNVPIESDSHLIYSKKHTIDHPSESTDATSNLDSVDTQHDDDPLRSQLRSRRLSQLLVALQDVIGTNEEDVPEHVDEPSMLADDSGSTSRSSEEPWTIVREPSDVEHDTPIARAHSELEDDDDDQNTVRLVASPRRSVISSSSSSSSPVCEPTPDLHSNHSPEGLSDILSPMSNLPFVPFLEDKYPDTIDSGYADNWISPFPLRLSPPRSPSVASVYGFFSPTSGTFPQHSTFASQSMSGVVTSDGLLLNQEPARESVEEVAQPSLSEGETTTLTPDEIGVAIEWPGPDHPVTSEPAEETLMVHPPAASTPPPAAIAEYYVGKHGPSGGESAEPAYSPRVNSLKNADTASNWSPSANSSLQFADLSEAEAETETENDSLQSLYDVYSGFSSPSTDLGPGSETGSILSDTSGSRSSPSSAFQIQCDPVCTPLPRRGGLSTAIIEVIPSPCFSHSSGQSSTQSLLEDAEEQGVTEVSYNTGVSQQILKRRRSGSKHIKKRLGSTPHTLKDKLTPRLAIEKPLDSLTHKSSNESSAPSRTSRLKPLRLSIAFGLDSPTSSSPVSSKSLSKTHIGFTNRTSLSINTASSDLSLSNKPLLSPVRSSLLPRHFRTSFISTIDKLHPPASHADQPQTAPLLHPNSWPAAFRPRNRFDHINHADGYPRSTSRQSEPAIIHEDDEGEYDEKHTYDHAIRRTAPVVPRIAPIARPATANATHSTFHAIATPRPTLLFAIASDDVDQVQRVLESGEARPSDQVGPQSALAFTLTNDKLAHKIDIVKALLAYGADPATLKNPETNPPQHPQGESENGCNKSPVSLPDVQFDKLLEELDPATRYYVCRADAAQTRRTSSLIHRSFFRPLTKVRYEIVGQDCVLEQLFRVLSLHSQQLSVTPIVVLLCGPSGHGKSLLARKFGSLLDVPTHTVNMTTLKSTHEIWQSCSMSPYEQPSSLTLAEFLVDNEGQRCVVVLDEIDKAEDERVLWSLLMPWELGRCPLGVGKRHIDVRNVIWLGTSNVGHELVFEYHASRQNSDQAISRDEYVELMHLTRPLVSERLGASLTSRVTTVLPFTPFSLNEKMAVSMEALYSLAGESVREMSPQAVESTIERALSGYIPAEGARSLYRAVSTRLVVESNQ